MQSSTACGASCLKAGVLVVLYLFLLQVVLGPSMATVILQL